MTWQWSYYILYFTKHGYIGKYPQTTIKQCSLLCCLKGRHVSHWHRSGDSFIRHLRLNLSNSILNDHSQCSYSVACELVYIYLKKQTLSVTTIPTVTVCYYLVSSYINRSISLFHTFKTTTQAFLDN